MGVTRSCDDQIQSESISMRSNMVAHSEILLSKCAQFREQGEFIDVRLKAGEDVFPAHRIVLAASSDYFHVMFTHGMKESNQEVIELKDENISAAALKIVMDSIYSGELHVDDENVFEVLLAADHLQVTSVVQQCCDYLQTEFIKVRFDVQTYCRICTIADRHNLTDLQEATQRRMASMYKEICESEEFLSHIDADQLSSLLSRDDLSAPSETFVFKSVTQWIKYKKDERMAVAAKVIGAVRLGLVDIREVIRELNTEEMQRVPEIHMLVYQSLVYSYIPSSSTFGEEQVKIRSMNLVLVAVCPQSQMQYFDVESKEWKLLESLAPATEATQCYFSETVGSKLYVAGTVSGIHCIYCYDIERNVWEKLPHSCGKIEQLCTVGDYMYAVSSDWRQVPQRYNFADQQWQSFAEVGVTGYYNFNSGAAALNLKVFVLYGKRGYVNSVLSPSIAVLYCFDPARNVWEEKASTCRCHFGSSLFVVNSRLYVVGGCDNLNGFIPSGNFASVEVYDEQNNMWSVVDQKHIPSNNLGAVEIEGKIYFIINRCPIDSGIRIPPGELYPVSLDKWKSLSNISNNAALCYAPVKRESLKTDS